MSLRAFLLIKAECDMQGPTLPPPAKLPPVSKQLHTNLYKLNRMETSRRP